MFFTDQIGWNIYIYSTGPPPLPFGSQRPCLSFRTWAGLLNQPVSPDSRKKLQNKAKDEGKEMVKVSISKKTNKKTVTGP